MSTSTTLQLSQFYANLLIIQYVGQTKAYNTVLSSITPLLMPQVSTQTIAFSPAPVSGTFTLSYGGVSTVSIAWNASAGTIQTDLRSITGLGSITVAGSIAAGLTVTFTSVYPVASLLVAATNALLGAASAAVTITFTETDLTLPLAIQGAFNLTTAAGSQLDILGDYVGVTRTSNTSAGTITLSDADFLVLIKFAIIQNASGSSMAEIEANFQIFFPSKFLITDYKIMRMTYVFTTALGSSNLFAVLLNENLLPAPMGVEVTAVTVPTLYPYFGCSTYYWVNTVAAPLNTYAAFNTSYKILSYANGITI